MNENFETLNFVLVGAKYTGKTIYLSSLFGAEKSITTINRESKDYLQEYWKQLDNGDIPSATSGRIVFLNLNYKTKQYNVDFRIDDYDGYFAETLSNEDSATQVDRSALLDSIVEAEGFILFFPFEGKLDEESIERFQHELNTFISLLREVYPGSNNLPIPVVIAVSKWDRSPYYKNDDETNKAISYIETIPQYKNAFNMIQNYFEYVVVIPMSSLGPTEDGVRPIKGSIRPHNITAPFEFLLGHFFTSIENKCNKFLSNSDHSGIFSLLNSWMHLLKLHDKFDFNEIYRNAINSLGDQVLYELKTNRSTSQVRQTLSKYDFFISKLTIDDTMRLRIENEASSFVKKFRRRNILISVPIVLLTIIGVTSYLYYKHDSERLRLIEKIRESQRIEPSITISLAENYLGTYEAEASEVEIIRSQALEKVNLKLKTDFEKVKKLRGSDDFNITLNQLLIYAKKFPSLPVTQRIVSFANEYQKTNAANESIAKHKSKMLSEANALLQESYTQEAALIEMGKQLRQLDDDDVVSKYIGLIDKKIEEIQKIRSYNELVGSIKNTDFMSNSIESDLRRIFDQLWRDDFSKDHKDAVIELLDQKFSKMDKERIHNFNSIYETSTEVKADRNLFSELQTKTYSIKHIGYRYVRPDTNKSLLKKVQSSLETAEQILAKGLKVNLSFSAHNVKNEPLGFNCSNYDHDINLSINGVKIRYDSDSDLCEEIYGKVTLHMANGNYFSLKSGHYDIKVEEYDLIDSSEETEGSFSVTEEMLLKLYNQRNILGQLEMQIKPTSYYIIFSINRE